MSGGSMHYLYEQVAEAHICFRSENDTPERRAFVKHLEKVAAALRAIEWNDSGDGADNEAELIRECLSDGAVLAEIVKEGEAAIARLKAEIARASGLGDLCS